jgi:hypothetical protein
MAITVTHAKVATILDDGTSEVGSNEWNAEHVVTGSTGDLMEVVNGGGVSTPFTIYVNGATGSESNSGLASTSALATIQQGVNRALYFAPRQETLHTDHSPNIIIQVSSGTYDEHVSIGGSQIGTLSINGAGYDTSGTHTLLTNGGFLAYDGAKVWVDNLAIDSNSFNPSLQAGYNAFIGAPQVEVHRTAFGIRFIGGSGFDTLLYAYQGGVVNIVNNSVPVEVVGPINRFARVQNKGRINISGTITLSTGVTITDAWAVGDTDGQIVSNTTWSGTATGKRFELYSGASIYPSTLSLTHFPGDAVGTGEGHARYGNTVYGLRPASHTFAELSTAPVAGQMALVSDSNTVTWGATIAGGSTSNVLAYFNGTNWTVAGV